MKKNVTKSEETKNHSKDISGQNELGSEVGITMYAPNLSVVPRAYRISDRLAELEKDFRKTCEEFFEKGKPDEYNSSYIDAVIEKICADAVELIRVQRMDHEQLIIKMLDEMHMGDYAYAKNRLELYLSDREENKKELEKYRRILWAGTSLEEGAIMSKT